MVRRPLGDRHLQHSFSGARLADVPDVSDIPSMAKYTLTLDDATAQRLEEQVAPYQGSVPGFAAALITPFSRLPVHEQDTIRKQIALWLTQHEAEALRGAPLPPPSQNEPRGAAEKLHAQFSPQRRQTQTLRFPRGKQNAKVKAPAVEV